MLVEVRNTTDGDLCLPLGELVLKRGTLDIGVDVLKSHLDHPVVSAWFGEGMLESDLERVEAEASLSTRIEADRLAAEAEEAAREEAKAEAARIEAERLEAERVAAEKAEADRLAAEAEKAKADAEAAAAAAAAAEAERLRLEAAKNEPSKPVTAKTTAANGK